MLLENLNQNKIALGVSYRGTLFHGWQIQPHKPTIQQHIEQALSFVADHPVQTVCAGRTDAGVHAHGQVIHFETIRNRPLQAWIKGTNTQLPTDIQVLWAKEVSADFSARFSAQARSYQYIIYNHSIPSVFLHHLVTWEYEPLDVNAMHAAAQFFLGEHDFTSFRAKECQSLSPFRCVLSISVTRRGQFVIIDITANAFLHHMVRNIVGVLLDVGKKLQDPAWVQQVLHARDRRAASKTAPASGLYLQQVHYADCWGLPEVDCRLWFVDSYPRKSDLRSP